MKKIILFLLIHLIPISTFAQSLRNACPPGLLLSIDGATCGTFVNAFCPTPGFEVWAPPLCSRPLQTERMVCPNGALLVFPTNGGGAGACFMPKAPSRLNPENPQMQEELERIN